MTLRCLIVHVPFLVLFATTLSSTNSAGQSTVHAWLTTEDRISLLAEQPMLRWSPVRQITKAGTVILVEDRTRYQTIDGFGHALTGGSAQLLMKMHPADRHRLLQELFGSGPNDVHTTYLRISVGASDMNDHVYTYDDLRSGTDPQLEHFSLAAEEQDVIPVLREILTLQPDIHIMATPWTAPAWMKSNHALKGGELQDQFYGTYAKYWIRYLTGMQAHGISIEALSPQNEPENAHNTPSMLMTAEQEARFIGSYLGPALAAAGLKTRIIAFDHNCDHPNYPETILGDPIAGRYTDGSGFHLYLGRIDALSRVHEAYPQKNIYFTEQMVVQERDEPELKLAAPVADLIIGAPDHWSRNVLLWNLAADSRNGPHTSDGGCPMCSGALTIEGDKVTRLVAYYTAAHASKFVPPGSVRIASDAGSAALPHIAFLTPRGEHVVLVSNNTSAGETVTLVVGKKQISIWLEAGSVETLVW